ncbi:KUP/HAK/KT family potassium transporter, partial [Klebsiella pneumoniae]|nr:KUP/HAK/KT family potassium transporter [Klebsiella pneumoniae]
IITRLKILPFIVTLATSLGAHGVALLLGKNDAVSIAADSNFGNFGQGDLFGLPIPGIVAVVAAVLGFGSSTALGSAYGIAVTGTMMITTFLTFYVVRYAWHYN